MRCVCGHAKFEWRAGDERLRVHCNYVYVYEDEDERGLGYGWERRWS